jgi:hypothetical protein
MDRKEIEILGRYNAERSRGVVHTQEWQRRMVELQKQFDLAQACFSEEKDSMRIGRDKN